MPQALLAKWDISPAMAGSSRPEKAGETNRDWYRQQQESTSRGRNEIMRLGPIPPRPGASNTRDVGFGTAEMHPSRPGAICKSKINRPEVATKLEG
jgi:hypothetical protein